MSNEQAASVTHPTNLSKAQVDELRAADPAAFDDDEATEAGDSSTDGEGQPSTEAKIEPEDVLAVDESAAATDADADAGKGHMIPKARFDEINATNKEMRQRIERLEAREALMTAAPDARDYAAERAALRAQYDDDETGMTHEEYEEKRDALAIDQQEHASSVKYHQLKQADAIKLAEQAWQQKVGAWQEQHQDFLANQHRRDIVAKLFDTLGTQPEFADNDALIAEVERQAFEAFNYTPAAVAGKKDAAPDNPHKSRNAADAAAQAAAAAAPGAIQGGMSDRSLVGGVDVNNIKQGEFKKLSKEQQEALLGEGGV